MNMKTRKLIQNADGKVKRKTADDWNFAENKLKSEKE